MLVTRTWDPGDMPIVPATLVLTRAVVAGTRREVGRRRRASATAPATQTP